MTLYENAACLSRAKSDLGGDSAAIAIRRSKKAEMRVPGQRWNREDALDRLIRLLLDPIERQVRRRAMRTAQTEDRTAVDGLR